jgi:hypothetical protein
MKIVLPTIAIAAVALIVSTSAYAEWTPVRIACIRAAGYQPADWDAYRVPAGPAAKYRACRDKAEGAARRR